MAVLGQKKNVIVGAARLFLGPALDDVATRPARVADESYAATLNDPAELLYNSVGYTQEGIEVSYEPEYGDVEVDQVLDSVRTYKTGMRVTMATTLAEATLDNLLIVWGQADTTLTTSSPLSGVEDELVIRSGDLGEAPIERSLIVVGNGSEGEFGYNERVYTAARALSVDSSSHALRRAEATVFPVTFRLLPTDQGDYGVVTDRTRTVGWITE